jgi:hypothetical protein
MNGRDNTDELRPMTCPKDDRRAPATASDKYTQCE